MFVMVFTFAVIVLLLVRDMLRKRSEKWKNLCKFPGDRPLPLIGNALTLGFDSDGATKRLMEMWERHGKTSFRVSVGSEDWVLLSEPDHVGALYNDPSILSKSPERNAAVIPFFGKSVSTSEGERWRWSRKLILSSFHVKSIGQRLDMVNAHSEKLIHMLNKCERKEAVSLYEYLRPFMLDVLFKTLMGVESRRSRSSISYRKWKLITENYFSYWRNIRPIFALTPMHEEMMTTIKTIRKTARDVIQKRKAIIQLIRDEIKISNEADTIDTEVIVRKKISENNNLLDAFLLKNLPNGDPVPEEVIDEEISFIYFTGHFTIAVTISHTLYCLAKNPEVQNRVLDEQQSIFNDEYSRKPTMSDLNKMIYLEAAVKETLRTIPTVPKIGRKLQNDLVIKVTSSYEQFGTFLMTMADSYMYNAGRDGRVIPAGTTAIVYYEAMFMNEKDFPEPYQFNPDRFLDNSIHPHAFSPFGGGPRSCIGSRFAWMAMKATLSNILRQFEVTPGGPGTEPQFSYRIVTESKNGVSLHFKNRTV